MKRVGDRRKTSIEWPAAVDDRLRVLVALAEQAGDAGATSASELLAALICDQPLDGARLAAVISSYRSAEQPAADGNPSTETVPRQRRRGRPRRAAGSDPEPAGERQ